MGPGVLVTTTAIEWEAICTAQMVQPQQTPGRQNGDQQGRPRGRLNPSTNF